MRHRTITPNVFVGLCVAMLQEHAAGQELVKQVVAGFRQSVVYLNVSRTTNTGAVVQSVGTGFIVSAKGHILTNCHVVDKVLRDGKGSVLPTTVDKVTITGAVASKEAFQESVSFLSCEQPGFDLALLKFKNSALPRRPVSVAPEALSIGDELAAMGFPLSTEFFARPGTFSSDADDDRMLVSMVLNAGDSGAPIFSKKVRVIGVAEAGYGPGIGVVRPIRHAVNLLAMAGVDLFAVDAAIPLSPVAGLPEKANIYFANQQAAIMSVGQSLRNGVPSGLEKFTATYPVFKQISASTSLDAPVVDIRTVQAQPGYRVTAAKFIVTDSAGVNVVHVGANPDGSGARAAFERGTSTLPTGELPFVKGFIETTQERLTGK